MIARARRAIGVFTLTLLGSGCLYRFVPAAPGSPLEIACAPGADTDTTGWQQYQMTDYVLRAPTHWYRQGSRGQMALRTEKADFYAWTATVYGGMPPVRDSVGVLCEFETQGYPVTLLAYQGQGDRRYTAVARMEQTPDGRWIWLRLESDRLERLREMRPIIERLQIVPRSAPRSSVRE